MCITGLASVLLVTLVLPIQVPPEPRWNGDQFYLGMRAVGASSPAAKTLGVESPTGAVVTRVEGNGPAESAGLRKGDLITWLGRDPIESLEDLVAAAAFSPIKEPLKLTYTRGGRRFESRLSMTGVSRLTPPTSYSHPDGAYQLRVPITWQLEQPGADADGPYALIESSERLYRVRLYRAARPAPEQGLAEFARRQSRPGSTTVRATIAGAPAVWVACAEGESPRVMVYDIALGIGGRPYRFRSTAPVLSDPERLPLPLQHFFSAFTFEAAPAGMPGAVPGPEIAVTSSPSKSAVDPSPSKPRVADARWQVPAAWRQLPAQSKDSEPCVRSYSMGSASAMVRVLRMDRPDGFLAWVVKEFAADLDEIDTVDLAGSPALRIAFSSEKRGMKGLLLASERRQSDQRAIAFLATTRTAEWAQHEPSVTKFLESVRFEPTAEPKP